MNFQNCIRHIQAKVLLEHITVVKCDWAIHRSVGCLELALQDLNKMDSAKTLRMYLIHLELDDASYEDLHFLTEVVI